MYLLLRERLLLVIHAFHFRSPSLYSVSLLLQCRYICLMYSPPRLMLLHSESPQVPLVSSFSKKQHTQSLFTMQSFYKSILLYTHTHTYKIFQWEKSVAIQDHCCCVTSSLSHFYMQKRNVCIVVGCTLYMWLNKLQKERDNED